MKDSLSSPSWAALLEVIAIGNTLTRFLLAAAAIASGILLVRVLERRLIGRWKRAAASTPGTVDDMVVDLVDRALMPLIYYGVFALVLGYLTLPNWVGGTLKVIGLALVAFYGARVATSVMGHLVTRAPAGGTTDTQRMRVVVPIVQVAIWSLALVFLLDNLGVQVSAVITGLGIGGIAVALAAQAILGDLFSYVAIVFDRPFSIGDLIEVDAFVGTVEHIGIKTTRVRSLGGELIIFGNSNLMGARVRNYRSMQRRQVVFAFAVIYQTPNSLLEQIPRVVQEIVTALPTATFDRAHLRALASATLDFEVAYFVESPSYHHYLDLQQAINLALKDRLEEMGVEFAAPVRPAPPPPAKPAAPAPAAPPR